MAKSEGAALDMSADPDEFAEAVNEFAARRVISREEADTLETYARRRSWWISGVAQMDIVNDAQKSIEAAIRNGTTFEDWKKAIGPKLEKAWGRKDSPRLLLVFRNATTSAYNAGRWRQMNQPHVKALRPYVKADAVDDARGSVVCDKFRPPNPPVILLMDDPYVLTHCFPLHHLCRSAWISMRRAVAEREGITQTPPQVDVTPGFGLPPDVAEPPKPTERTDPPDTQLQLVNSDKAIRDTQERKPVKLKQPDKLSPEYWEKHYREQYGDAASVVGYGRMIHERAKEMPWDEALAAARELADARVPGFGESTVRALEKVSRYGMKSVPGHEATAAEGARLLVTHRKFLKARRTTPFELKNPIDFTASGRERFKSVAKFYEELSSQALDVPDARWFLKSERNFRSYANPEAKWVFVASDTSVGTWVHEWAHIVEVHSPNIVKRVTAFREHRERDSAVELMADVVPFSGYGQDEKTRKDKYWKAYMGKIYSGTYSELVSTLLGDMANGMTGGILADDPESAYFALGVLAGV